MQWKRVNPVYVVDDVRAAIEWYRMTLGLSPGHINESSSGPNYAVLARDGASVLHLLRRAEAPHGLAAPTEAQFWIDGDIDALFAQLVQLGVRVVESPADREWGHRDFIVADPDSNLVWITKPLSE